MFTCIGAETYTLGGATPIAVPCFLVSGAAAFVAGWATIELGESMIANCDKCCGREDEVDKLKKEVEDLKKQVDEIKKALDLAEEAANEEGSANEKK